MNTGLILYDRIWLSEYINRIAYQRNLAQSLEERLEREKVITLPEFQEYYGETLRQISELSWSLKVTEDVLRDYLDNAEHAAFQLQRRCEEICR